MEIDLSLIGMEKGRQYETIITTQNNEGTKHAAPIGVLCSGRDTILNRIFKGSHTLDNIVSQKESKKTTSISIFFCCKISLPNTKSRLPPPIAKQTVPSSASQPIHDI